MIIKYNKNILITNIKNKIAHIKMIKIQNQIYYSMISKKV